MKDKNIGINILIVLISIIIVGMILVFKSGGLWQGLVFILGILLLVFLVFYRTKIYKYKCVKCKKTFKTSFKESILSFNFNRKEKYLLCPYCSHTGWAKEILIKKNGKM